MSDPTVKFALMMMTATVGLALAGWLLVFIVVALIGMARQRFSPLFQKMDDSAIWVFFIALVLLFAAFLSAGIFDFVQLIRKAAL